MTDNEYVDPGILEYGVLPPDSEDYDSSEAYTAAYDEWLAGFEAYLNRKRAAEAQAEVERLAREEAERAAAEEVARQVREEEVRAAQEVEQLLEDDPGTSDRYQIGSYVDAAGNVWSSTGELLSGDGVLTDSYVDPAGHLWTMEYSTPPMETQSQAEGEVVPGDPTIDTALLLLDLMEALTGEDGMTSDVEGIQEVLEHPLMTASFQDYTVTEGLLLLLLLSIFMAVCAQMLKEGFAWLR